MIGTLPKFFKLKAVDDLIRLGGRHDGGYLVSEKDVKSSDILVSLGMGINWRFEIDFIKKNNVPLNIYDASVDKKYFLSLVKNSIIRFYRPSSFLFYFKLYISYINFFKNTKKHIEKFVSSNLNVCSSDKEKYCTFDDVLKNIESKNIFLKIDIEGDEYRILDTILGYQDRITSLVIEFHNCDLHLSKIENFINKFSLCLVHIHANNFTPICAQNNLPLTLEITFSKNFNLLSNKNSLNSKLDMTNSEHREEINLMLEK
jgi:hypothetical protein